MQIMKTPQTRAGETKAIGLPGTDVNRAGLGAAAWISAGMMETLAAMGSEVMQFVAARIAEDMKTQHALLTCKDMVEAQRIQSAFVKTALEQYSASTGKLVELGAGVMTASMPGRAKDNDPV
jgi:hypothetical protein